MKFCRKIFIIIFPIKIFLMIFIILLYINIQPDKLQFYKII